MASERYINKVISNTVKVNFSKNKMLVPWQNRLGRRYDHMMSKSRRKWCKINLQVQDETKGNTVITCNYSNEIDKNTNSKKFF